MSLPLASVVIFPFLRQQLHSFSLLQVCPKTLELWVSTPWWRWPTSKKNITYDARGHNAAVVIQVSCTSTSNIACVSLTGPSKANNPQTIWCLCWNYQQDTTHDSSWPLGSMVNMRVRSETLRLVRSLDRYHSYSHVMNVSFKDNCFGKGNVVYAELGRVYPPVSGWTSDQGLHN